MLYFYVMPPLSAGLKDPLTPHCRSRRLCNLRHIWRHLLKRPTWILETFQGDTRPDRRKELFRSEHFWLNRREKNYANK